MKLEDYKTIITFIHNHPSNSPRKTLYDTISQFSLNHSRHTITSIFLTDYQNQIKRTLHAKSQEKNAKKYHRIYCQRIEKWKMSRRFRISANRSDAEVSGHLVAAVDKQDNVEGRSSTGEKGMDDSKPMEVACDEPILIEIANNVKISAFLLARIVVEQHLYTERRSMEERTKIDSLHHARGGSEIKPVEENECLFHHKSNLSLSKSSVEIKSTILEEPGKRNDATNKRRIEITGVEDRASCFVSNTPSCQPVLRVEAPFCKDNSIYTERKVEEDSVYFTRKLKKVGVPAHQFQQEDQDAQEDGPSQHPSTSSSLCEDSSNNIYTVSEGRRQSSLQNSYSSTVDSAAEGIRDGKQNILEELQLDKLSLDGGKPGEHSPKVSVAPVTSNSQSIPLTIKDSSVDIQEQLTINKLSRDLTKLEATSPKESSIKNPPVSIKNQLSKLMKNPFLIGDKILQDQVLQCISYDISYGPINDAIRHSIGLEHEAKLIEHVKNCNLPYLDENDLRRRGYDKTPDVKLEAPFLYRDHPVCWIESKASFGDVETNKQYLKDQYYSYWNRFGPGLVIYWFGFIDELTDEMKSKDIMLLDHFPDKSEMTFMDL